MPPTNIDYEALVDQILKKMGTTTKGVVSPPPTATYGHGPGGLFSYPGLSKPVFSAMVLPRLGLQSMLPARGNQDANPLFGTFTGVTATTGEEPNGVCDDPPTVGLAKLCTQSFVYGREARQTKVYDLDRMGLWTNRGEFGDLQFLGQPFQGANPNIPTIPGGAGANPLQNEIAKTMFEFAVAWARDFARDLYTGNPINNTGGGGRKYYRGLDFLINTGYRDAVTLQACPAADSIVRSFGSLDVATNAIAMIRQLTSIHRNLKYLASSAGLDPVNWVLAMRWSLFYELTEVWPCAYLSYRCSNLNAGSQQFINSEAQVAMRDALRGNIYDRTGQYLLIDGERVPVVIDDGIPETVLAGESFTSTIYYVPLSVLGGTPVTYLEYVNYDAPNGAMEAARALAPDGFYSTSDSGRFLWHKKPPANFCVQMMAKTEPRLVLLTPHLAARLTSVKYTPFAHERDWDPASSFFVDGGRTDYGGYGPSFGAQVEEAPR